MGVGRAAVIAVLTALVNWFALTPSNAVAEPSAPLLVYAYDGLAHTAPANDSTTERGPPAACDRSTAYDAVDLWSLGASARLGVAATPATYTYDDAARLARRALGSHGAKDRNGGGEAPQSVLVSPQPTGVAANAERRVFSNLAPGDAVRQAGFHAISPTSLKGVSGRYNYVVGTDGRLVIGNRRFGHIDLANGGNVLAAGEFRIVQGQVRSINNASGHYRPVGPSAQAAAEQAFGSSGLMVRSGAYTEIVP